MLKTKSFLKRSMVGMTVAVQVMFFPAFALADHPTAPAEPAHKCPAASGTNRPTGSDGHMFTFNPNKDKCIWENSYYTWDPVTKVKTALKAPAIWIYSPAAGAYTERPQPAPPQAPAPTPPPATPGASGAGVQTPSSNSNSSSPAGSLNAATNGQPSGANGSSIGNTGPDSDNTIDNGQANDITFDLNGNVVVTNNIDSTSVSGNAGVQGNTNGGSASTGDAEAMANILNLLQSSWNPSSGDITTFSADIYDHQGDLLFDPSTIINTGPGSQNGINSNIDNNLDVNIQNDGRIVNNVDLAAQSGDATVSGNTNGGNASTGDAAAVVNIFNLINSMIAPGSSSFIGTINILGSLDGDILLPGLFNSIGNTGPDSANTVTNNQDNDVNVTSVDNRTITNNTNLAAASGNANVSGNTNGGDASTGTAQTKLNIFNLTGRSIAAENGLLVFVNVLGQWAGFIFDAPAGQNSVLGTGPGSTNTVNNNVSNDVDIDSTSNSAIENNITATANSGNAAVTNNTNGGNASTGDATASANIANVINSELNFSDWFGVLFINVLGDWNGWFGRDTAAGNKPKAEPAVKTGRSGTGSKTSENPPRKVAEVFGFFAGNSSLNGAAGQTGGSATGNGNNSALVQTAAATQTKKDTKPADAGMVLASNNDSNMGEAANNGTAAAIKNNGLNLSLPAIGILVALALFGTERWLTLRGKKAS